MQKSQFREIVERTIKEVQDSSFNLDTFASIPSFKKRIQYCDERLEKLGAGSSRIVYKLTEERVLKIAKNNKGIAQNTREADFSRNAYGITAELYNADMDNYTWVEMERAYPIKKSEVQSITGVTFLDLCAIICYIHDEYSRPNDKIYARYGHDPSSIKEIMEKEVYTEKNEFLYRLYTYLSNYQPSTIADYCRIQNWGKTRHNGSWEMVIIDDGYDENVAKLYGRM